MIKGSILSQARNEIGVSFLRGHPEMRSRNFESFFDTPSPPLSRFLVIWLHYCRHKILDTPPSKAVFMSFMDDP